jgi:tetratricopeptide (TPR) repeat protein
MMSTIEEAEQELRLGMRLARQSTYARRFPNVEALPHLYRALDLLKELATTDPTSAEKWELTSLAYECLLKYPPAIECLVKAISISGAPTKSQRKRLAMLRENLQTWTKLKLSAQQIQELGAYLKANHADTRSEIRNMDDTERWLRQQEISDVEEVLKGFRDCGAYTDFQIYHNVCCG